MRSWRDNKSPAAHKFAENRKQPQSALNAIDGRSSSECFRGLCFHVLPERRKGNPKTP